MDDFAATIRPMLEAGALDSGRFRPEWDAALDAVDAWEAEGERDRQQIARLTEAVDTLKNGPLLGILETYRRVHPDDHLVLSVVIAEIQEIAAVLAGEEDAATPEPICPGCKRPVSECRAEDVDEGATHG